MEEPNDADLDDAQDKETYPIYGRSTERKLDVIEVASDLVISVMQTMATVLGLVWAMEVTTAQNDSSGSALKALGRDNKRHPQPLLCALGERSCKTINEDMTLFHVNFQAQLSQLDGQVCLEREDLVDRRHKRHIVQV